jgi:hypothetical protein
MPTVSRSLLEKYYYTLLRLCCLANKISLGFKHPPSLIPEKRGKGIEEVIAVVCCCKLVQLHSECASDFYLCMVDLEGLW